MSVEKCLAVLALVFVVKCSAGNNTITDEVSSLCNQGRLAFSKSYWSVILNTLKSKEL